MAAVELHPQCKALLQRGVGQPTLMDIGVYESRIRTHGELDISGPVDPSVNIRHIYFTGPTADLPLRIYQPEGVGPFNGMVYFHGGGWVTMDASKYDAPLSAMARLTNSVVVSVNYQKAPEHKFPIPFDDCFATWNWTLANVGKLNIDPSKLGIGGSSAGANLAAAVALKIRDLGEDKLAYQWLVYPITDNDFDTPSYLQNAENFGLTRAAMKALVGLYLSRVEDFMNPYAFPAKAKNFHGVAPAIILTAGYDPLHDDGERYAKALHSDGVYVSYLDLPDMIHGFFTCGKYIDQGIDIRRYFADEILKVLRESI
jgi:acetyl esterase